MGTEVGTYEGANTGRPVGTKVGLLLVGTRVGLRDGTPLVGFGVGTSVDIVG